MFIAWFTNRPIHDVLLAGLGQCLPGDRCGRNGGNSLGPGYYIQMCLVLLKFFPKFFQRPCSISGQGVCTVWGAESNGGDVAGKQQPWRPVLPGSSAWGMFCNERGPKARV